MCEKSKSHAREELCKKSKSHQRSWWIVHTQPTTRRDGSTAFLNPTNAVGGLSILNLHRASGTLFRTSHQCSWWVRKNLIACVHRLSMNVPPTALVGFGKRRGPAARRRLSMNDPPTALVGFGFFTQSADRWSRNTKN